MEYGINIGFIANKTGMKKAAEIISKAGFTQLDYTPPLHEDNWAEIMKEDMKIFEGNGLVVHQTHGPFNRYRTYNDELFLSCIERCAEVTEYTKAKYMVVHADEFDIENRAFTDEAAKEYNHKLYKPYVERALKNGYKIAFETVFEDGWGKCRRYTSDINELYDMIKSFESEAAVCCWDFGHANVAFDKKAPDNIKRMGGLIECTHLHDNAGNDSHQMPMTGDIDWKATMDAMHSIDYKGIMCIEYAHGSMPVELTDSFIKLSFETAGYLWNLK